MKTDNSAFTIQSQSIAYFSVLDKERSLGVLNKIHATLKGAEKNYFTTRSWIHPFEKDGIKKLKDAIIESNEELILLRSIGQFNFLLVPAIWKARKRGQKVIIDVPTPNRVAVYEILKSKLRIITKIKYLSYLILSGPIPFWFVHRVIQYAREGEWFLLGNKRKTKIIGNGIDFEDFPSRTKFPVWPSNRLRLLVVASLNHWHGVDRLIKAMHVFNKVHSSKFRVHLTVVGEGPALNDLKKLVIDLGLQKDVDFKGFLKDQALNECYENCHVGVGSLGLFRIKLKEASILKAREYTAYGLPFIASGNDPDFPAGTSFRYNVANSEEIDSIIYFFHNFNCFYKQISIDEIRLFAKQKLDYAAKFHQISEGL